MSLSNKVTSANDGKLVATSKLTNLNPNAIEFIPFALRSPSGSTSSIDASARFGTSNCSTLGKAALDRSSSSTSNNSDEEAHQYWRHQLPDDITPDFKVMGQDDSTGVNGLSFSNLSLAGGNETSRLSIPISTGFILEGQQELSPQRINGNSFGEKMRYSVSTHGEVPSSTSFHHLSTKPLDKQFGNTDQFLMNLTGCRDGSPFNGNIKHSFVHDMVNEQALVDSMDVNPIDVLASQFPGFAAESLAEVYVANGGDLSLTIEMLTQLELQVDAGSNQNMNSKALSGPNLSALDFPALSVADSQNGLQNFLGDDLQQNIGPYWSSVKDNILMFKSSSSGPSRGTTNFASAVKKMASQDSSIWKFERNGSAGVNVGSSGSSHVMASSYSSGQGKDIYGDRFQNRSSTCAAPVWIETGEAVANMYSEVREEARDHARLRNAYFEQARQAYLIGNKALAKELSIKGQLHNMHMKAAHGKAQESIFRQRNPLSVEMHSNGRGQERMIDLHGLHVSEAIHVLKRELAELRNAARSGDQRLQIYICVGTGHHTRGARSLARLPVAVQCYLLEEEGLDYYEPQPGLLRVVLY